MLWDQLRGSNGLCWHLDRLTICVAQSVWVATILEEGLQNVANPRLVAEVLCITGMRRPIAVQSR